MAIIGLISIRLWGNCILKSDNLACCRLASNLNCRRFKEKPDCSSNPNRLMEIFTESSDSALIDSFDNKFLKSIWFGSNCPRRMGADNMSYLIFPRRMIALFILKFIFFFGVFLSLLKASIINCRFVSELGVSFFMRASRPNSCIFVKTNSRSTSKSEREIPADILLAYNKVSPFKSGIYAPNSSNLLNGDICIRSIVMFVSKSADSSFMPMYLTLSCMLGIDNKM